MCFTRFSKYWNVWIDSLTPCLKQKVKRLQINKKDTDGSFAGLDAFHPAVKMIYPLNGFEFRFFFDAFCSQEQFFKIDFRWFFESQNDDVAAIYFR